LSTASLIHIPKILPSDLVSANVWLVWRYVPHEDKNKKPRKIPFYTNGRARGEHGSDRDRSSLVPFADALKRCKEGHYSGVGLATLDDLPYCAVDFDNCLKNGKLLRPELRTFIDSTYSEVSPSGNGLRLIYKGKTGVGASLKNVPAGIELFDGTGFVTITGKRYTKNAVARTTDEIRGKLRAMVRGGKDRDPKPEDDDDFSHMESLGRLQTMLEKLPVHDIDDRKAWLRAGMAVHKATNGSDAGFEIWDKWSKRSEKYGETEKTWKSFSEKGSGAGTVGAATLAYMAREEEEEDDPLGLTPKKDFEQWPTLAMIANANEWDAVPPPKEMLFKDFMPHGELAALAGAGGEGKSWLSLQMACSIATGIPFCGKWEPARKGRILMLNAEDTADDFWRRVHMLAEKEMWTPKVWAAFKKNVDIAPVAGYDKMMNKEVNGVLVASNIAKRLRRTVAERDYVIVVVDPAIYFRAGDENDAMVTAAFMDTLAPSCNSGKCTVMVIQHVAKGTRGKDELSLEDLRGSTALSGAVRWASVMRGMTMKEMETYPVEEEERRHYVQLNIVKNSHGPVATFWLRRKEHSAVFEHVEMVPTVREEQPRGVARTGKAGRFSTFTDEDILALLNEADYNQRELAGHFGVTQVAINHRLRRMRDAGLLDGANRPTDLS